MTLVSSLTEAPPVKGSGATVCRKPALELPLSVLMREGRKVIGPKLAERILKQAHYDGQRKTYDHHVTLLADMMRRSTWTAGSQIAFAKVGDRLFLVNGRHRMHAVLASQRDVEFQVLVVDAADMAGVAALYYHFDVATRVRGTAEILNAVGAAEEHHVSRGMAKGLYSAVGYIENGLIIPSYLQNPIRARSVDHRLAAARPWWVFGAQYEEVIKPADGRVRRKLLRPGTMAVGLVTLRYQPERAMAFWDGVARNDGLRRGDPRHTFLADLANRPGNSGTHLQTTIVPAAAWNAWFDGKTIGHIKVTASMVPKVHGTPFDGRRR